MQEDLEGETQDIITQDYQEIILYLYRLVYKDEIFFTKYSVIFN
mgnify:CR=1 FL=1